MITCKRCQADKRESEMLQRRGKVSKVCLDCFGKAMAKGADAEKGRGNKGGKRKRPSKIAKEFVAGLQDFGGKQADTGLTVERGSGFRAALDGEQLVIEQDNVDRPETPDNLTLSRSEFYVLVKKYAPWAGIPLAEKQ